MTIVLREIRDLRGGVTRQLVEQDKRIAALQADMHGLTDGVAGLRGSVSGLKSDMTDVQSKLDRVDGRLAKLTDTVGTILSRLPAHD